MHEFGFVCAMCRLSFVHRVCSGRSDYVSMTTNRVAVVQECRTAGLVLSSVILFDEHSTSFRSLFRFLAESASEISKIPFEEFANISKVLVDSPILRRCASSWLRARIPGACD